MTTLNRYISKIKSNHIEILATTKAWLKASGEDKARLHEKLKRLDKEAHEVAQRAMRDIKEHKRVSLKIRHRKLKPLPLP